jgi:hypothetical protein
MPTEAATTATAEKIGEDILEASATSRTSTAAETAREPSTARPTGPTGKASTAAHGANLVIFFALLFVANDAERFTDFFEFGLGFGIARV